MAKILLKRKTGIPVLSGGNADQLQEGELGIVGSKLLYGPNSGGSSLVDPKQIAVTNDSNSFSGNNTFLNGDFIFRIANTKQFTFQNEDGDLTNYYYADSSGHLRTNITNNNLTGTMLVNANYVNNLLGEVDAMIFKGTVNADTGMIDSDDASIDAKYLKGEHDLITNYSAGWTFKVSTAGTIAGLTPDSTLEVGDMIIIVRNYDSSFNIGDFHSLQGNVDGAVTGPSSSTDNAVALFNSTSGRVIKNSALIFNGSNLNIPGSLTLGTQTNKATINYATNTSRTLTIPNVGGNRTFAFINQAQTFSAEQTFSNATTNFTAATTTLRFNSTGGRTANLFTDSTSLGLEKTINLGTGGNSGSNTTINIGPTSNLRTINIGGILVATNIISPNGSFYREVNTDLPTGTQNLKYAGHFYATEFHGAWNGSTIPVNRGGTGQTSYTNGQLLIGNSTGNTLTKATLTQGGGITITNSTGSITITNSAPHQGTDLGTSVISNGRSITSSTGTNIIIPAASTTVAGFMSHTDKIKLDGIDTISQANIRNSSNTTAGLITGQRFAQGLSRDGITTAGTMDIGTWAVGDEETKTINLGTGGDTGSTTNINIGEVSGLKYIDTNVKGSAVNIESDNSWLRLADDHVADLRAVSLEINGITGHNLSIQRYGSPVNPTYSGILVQPDITDHRTWTLPDKTGTLETEGHSIGSHSATAWRMFYSNSTTTAIQQLAFGAANTYLRSAGASAAPTWTAFAALTAGTGLTSSSGTYTPTAAKTFSLTNIAAGSSSAGAVYYNGITPSAGRFNGSSTAPTGTTRLNYSGHLYATKFFAGTTGIQINSSSITAGNGDQLHFFVDSGSQTATFNEDGVFTAPQFEGLIDGGTWT